MSSLHLNAEWLRQKYEVEKLSTYQIAEIVNRNPKNIYQKLKDFGIPTRTRAETLAQNSWWNLGKPSARKGTRHTKATRQKIQLKATGRPGLRGSKNPMFGKRSPNWKGGTTPERQALYSSREWASVVCAVWKRDCAKCQRCGCPKTKDKTFDIHHIVSFSVKELRTELSNLVLLCRACHKFVHSRKNTAKVFLG